MHAIRQIRLAIGRRAELTQLVECQLPKLDVAGSNPVLRSFSCPGSFGPHPLAGKDLPLVFVTRGPCPCLSRGRAATPLCTGGSPGHAAEVWLPFSSASMVVSGRR